MKQPPFDSARRSSSQLSFGSSTLLVGVAALLVYGLSRRSKSSTDSVKAAAVPKEHAKAIFLVNASPESAYALWRDFENLPRFMAHLKSVRTLEDGSLEWTAVGPLKKEIRWKAEITEDRPDQQISWQSLPGSQITTNGTVQFRPDPLGRGTFVTAEVLYSAPGGSVGSALATLLGKSPEFMIREDIRRFKALLEAGEAPTTVGQPHGPRGVHGHLEQFLFRETSNHPQPQATLAKTA